jgi:hypothetical protein
MKAKTRRRGPKRGESHVRFYAYELESPAYRTLSTDARALLIEFRALYTGKQNRVFLSVREMASRLCIGQRRAQHARDELLERGWIKIVELGSFNRKTKSATIFALTNEPLEDRIGATASKDFMRWQPQEKSTVVATTTHGSCHDYRDDPKSSLNSSNGSRHDYRKPENATCTVATTATQISYQRSAASDDSFVWAAMTPAIPDSVQRTLLAAWLLMNQKSMQAAA